ncbi:hypothetical protein MPTK1_4g17800 [Marchantia polymorpha subsp. ruderalis]|uniref:Uncharacterized protein n=2 Tax=Marchantia polymorpha TaxID=3197 RepID=A0AAF6BAZ4_MARPO|nr:hypothetical protein MARPO_0041s0061 [Marchantia polymorpha]BBN09178.1 hypothetical protein Mp_4g17800 [Marchantia polymorpha subsp. ruderalis]|eukprot:PTQ40166.1 hypothetical protein MARPO_0041s0061 [Marchantia polymorpha]
MDLSSIKWSPLLAMAYVLGISFLHSGMRSANAEPIVIHSRSYIVTYQNATCDCHSGKLLLLGPNRPLVLTGDGQLHMTVETVDSNSWLYTWNQTLVKGTDKPPRYVISQNFTNVDYPDDYFPTCMYVDYDEEVGNDIGTDSCVWSSGFIFFEYHFVKRAPGCAAKNKNGYIVQIKPYAFHGLGPDRDYCFSAVKKAGVSPTIQKCNSSDEKQLFFVNVPFKPRKPWM